MVVWTRKGARNLTVAFCVIAVTWLYNIVYVVIAVSTKRDYYNPDPVSLYITLLLQSALPRFCVVVVLDWRPVYERQNYG